MKFIKPILFLFFIAGLLIACRKEFADPSQNDPGIDVNPKATAYPLEIPPFFPPMDIPTDNPLTKEAVALGRHLFWDPILSGDNSMSCATCHLPEHAFSDPAQFSTGITGAVGTRQTMALFNLGWAHNYFWDGRARTLEEQVVGPVENPIEMNQDWDELLQELALAPNYPELFEAAFGSPEITKKRSARALASFLRIMISADSKFDKQRLGQYEFTPSEQNGFELFLREGGDPSNGQGGQWGADCFHCHGFGDMQFSDYRPHNNGLDHTFSDLGVGGITGSPREMGQFKTPSLRNVALSAPYMHDGRFSTLEEVIGHYNSGGKVSATIDPFMKYTSGGLQLSAKDQADLISFLHCLTDTTYIHNSAFSNPHE